METHHRLVIGDSRQMKEVGDATVHLVITSPPYWQLKDYGKGDQIGFDDSYEEYINNLNLVWAECHRVLHPGCRLCVNIGDQFARSVYYGRYKVIPIRTEIIKFCESVGFDYMGAVIWQKVTTCHTSGGATVMGSFPYPRNGILKLDYEFILIFKKYGKPPKVSKEVKEQSKMSTDEWNEYFSGHWNFSGEKQKGHLAMFPLELPRRLIKMYSFVGDNVLDPFLGSGTTSLAARELKRNSLGYEINEMYLDLIEEKLGEGGSLEVTRMCREKTNPMAGMDRLPYLFKDPIRFDRKVDPKGLRFDSKLDTSPFEKEEYHTVREIISPEVLVLSNGSRVRLLGVKEREETKAEALMFLREKTKGQKVFIRHDDSPQDSSDGVFCYLYLKNRTFLNAHLLKKGLADVDIGRDYKHRSKFLKY